MSAWKEQATSTQKEIQEILYAKDMAEEETEQYRKRAEALSDQVEALKLELEEERLMLDNEVQNAKYGTTEMKSKISKLESLIEDMEREVRKCASSIDLFTNEFLKFAKGESFIKKMVGKKF